MNLSELKKEILSKIVDKDIKKIILFGSFAYGTPTKDSDIDLLIVKDRVLSKIKEALEIRKKIKSIKMPKDIIVTTKEEFDFYKNEFGSIMKIANEKGIVFYEKTVYIQKVIGE